MDPSARLTQAIDAALDTVVANAPASVVTRAALRVATLRQDVLAEFWLSVEISGIGRATKEQNAVRNAELVSRLTAFVGAEEAELSRLSVLEAVLSRRSVEREGKTVIMSHGVADLEAHHDSMRAIYDDPVTPGMTPLDTGLASIDHERNRAQLAPALLQQRTVLERIKDAAYSYALESEAQLLAGESIPDVVAKGRAFVEGGLALRAPDALAALQAAETATAQDQPESASHAATSCRRAIKALADSLYPPSGPVTADDGITRSMDDDHYRNRLIEYVRQRKGRSTHADVLASNLTSLGTRLKSLDDLASKGVHANLSRAEVESCLTWMYMLAADLLRIAAESAD